MVKLVSIDGNIGSSKTTLINMLESSGHFPNAVFVREPVGMWQQVKDKYGEDILSKYYSNQKKYAYCFQELTLMSRYKALKNAIRENPGKTIFIERSIWTDKNVFAKMLHDSGDIEDIMYQIYLENFKVIEEDFQIYRHVYIDTEPGMCMERVKKRNREGEDISLDYLVKCKQYHDEWLNNTDNVLKINGTVEFETDPSQFIKIVSCIKNFLPMKTNTAEFS